MRKVFLKYSQPRVVVGITILLVSWSPRHSFHCLGCASFQSFSTMLSDQSRQQILSRGIRKIRYSDGVNSYIGQSKQHVIGIRPLWFCLEHLHSLKASDILSKSALTWPVSRGQISVIYTLVTQANTEESFMNCNDLKVACHPDFKPYLVSPASLFLNWHHPTLIETVMIPQQLQR